MIDTHISKNTIILLFVVILLSSCSTRHQSMSRPVGRVVLGSSQIGHADNTCQLLDKILKRHKPFIADSTIKKIRKIIITPNIAESLFKSDTIYVIDTYSISNWAFNELIMGDSVSVTYTYRQGLGETYINQEWLEPEIVQAIVNWDIPYIKNYNDTEFMYRQEVVFAYRIMRNFKKKYYMEWMKIFG